jgi:hypothetical protein
MDPVAPRPRAGCALDQIGELSRATDRLDLPALDDRAGDRARAPLLAEAPQQGRDLRSSRMSSGPSARRETPRSGSSSCAEEIPRSNRMR